MLLKCVRGSAERVSKDLSEFLCTMWYFFG